MASNKPFGTEILKGDEIKLCLLDQANPKASQEILRFKDKEEHDKLIAPSLVSYKAKHKPVGKVTMIIKYRNFNNVLEESIDTFLKDTDNLKKKMADMIEIFKS